MPFSRVLALALCFGVSGAAYADNAGSYLAGRTAALSNDYEEAADYFTRALIRDPGNIVLIESALNSFVGLGNLDRSVPLARRLQEAGAQSQLANLVLHGRAAQDGEWDALIEALQNGQDVGPLFDGLVTAWAELGAGRMSDAVSAFDTVIGTAGVSAFGNYHKALALGSVGDFESAAEIFDGEGGATIRLTRSGAMAYAQVLSQLERQDDALAHLNETFGSTPDPTIREMVNSLSAGEVLPFDVARNAQDGVAEVYSSIAGALLGEAQDNLTLIYSRMALALRPDDIETVLMTAELLERLERYELATEVYDTVPRSSPAFFDAELGRADALRRADKADASIEVLRQLAESHGELSEVHISLGDALRGLERYEESAAAYDQALDIIGEPDEQHWIVHFARAISRERMGQWPQAEADFRKALELRPEQPQVLNYLGYSFLELQTNLDEALDMIERAVALRPDAGHIVDSLGWGLYRVGRYEEAVGHMERAVELMPVDPVVNDHLGDVYWAVGRAREAEFQWLRALSFITDDTDLTDIEPDRIRRKLEVGLDVVLEEEGAPPLEVANDDG